MKAAPNLNPLPAPTHPLNEEETRRYQLLGEEARPLVPGGVRAR